MAQLIQHKRGRLERLSTITGSLQKGEILIVTGSSNITSSNGSSILFAATESGSVQATNRFIIGSSAPNVFPASTYGGLVNGVPYYDSGSGTLYLLGSDGNTPINLTGNISAFSSSVATSFSASNASIASVTGDFSSSVATSFSASNASQIALSSSVATSFSSSQAAETILSSSIATSISASNASITTLSSSISASIIEIVSASLSSSLSVIATDFEIAIVSASLSASQNLISSSISSSIAETLSGSVASISSLSSSLATSISASNASITSLSSSISQSIVDIVSASLSSSLSVIATDIEVAIVSASLSSSQALISSSISSSIAETLSGSAASITSLSSSVSASLATLSASSGFISYVTNSVQNLTGIEVADYSADVAVTFVNGTLKFIFGTPLAPTSVAASTSGFATDRFNNVTDAYSVNGTWNNQGYTLVSASLYEGATLLTQVGSGTSLTYSTTTSGSHTYRLEYTASSPLDNSLYKTSTTTTGTVSKTTPAAPTLTPTTTIQLGTTSNQIEQGATGNITFTSSSANPSNNWNLTSVTTNVATPYYVTGSATGSTSISITATANYASPTGENIPDTTATSTTTTTYNKIRSLRYGASTATSFTAGELENLALWDTTLGGTIGTIAKGTTTASGQSVTISWTGDKYHYIVFNSSLSNLTNITTSGFGVFGEFALTTVGQYKVYKSTTLKAGGVGGNSITYVLT
jgi:epidermal growth factor receptor substrate 15